MEGFQVTAEASFELERMRRAIEQVQDIAELRNLAKSLAEGFFVQKAAARWAMGQGPLRQGAQPAAAVPPWDDPLL